MGQAVAQRKLRGRLVWRFLHQSPEQSRRSGPEGALLAAPAAAVVLLMEILLRRNAAREKAEAERRARDDAHALARRQSEQSAIQGAPVGAVEIYLHRGKPET